MFRADVLFRGRLSPRARGFVSGSESDDTLSYLSLPGRHRRRGGALRPTPFRVTRFCPALGHGGRISGGRVSLAGCFGAVRAERVGERDGPNGLGARVSARLG